MLALISLLVLSVFAFIRTPLRTPVVLSIILCLDSLSTHTYTTTPLHNSQAEKYFLSTILHVLHFCTRRLERLCILHLCRDLIFGSYLDVLPPSALPGCHTPLTLPYWTA